MDDLRHCQAAHRDLVPQRHGGGHVPVPLDHPLGPGGEVEQSISDCSLAALSVIV